MKTSNKKLSIGLLIGLVGLPQISETVYTPALPNVAISLSANASMVETTLAIYFIGFALGVLLWGIISDWSGRRKAMLSGLLIYGIATVGCGSVKSIEALLGWRLVQAFGASVGSVITQTILRDAFDSHERSKLFSVMSGALAFSPAIGPLVGGYISELLGWRANFWTLAILAIILSIWSYISLPETRPAHFNQKSSNKISDLFFKMLKNHVVWGHILLIAATNGVIFGFYQEAPFIFIEQLGISPSHYGFFGILIAAATILAAHISYKNSRQCPVETIISYGTGFVIMGGVIFTFNVLMGGFMLSDIGLGLGVIALFVIFFGIGLIIPNSLSHALKPYQTAAGTAGSIFGGCYYCLIAGCTWLLSMIHNGTAFPLPLYITGLAFVMLLGSKMIRPSKTEVLNT